MNNGWFIKLSPMARQEYLRKHPKSKLRGRSGVKKVKGLRPGVTKLKVKRPRPEVEDDGDEGLF